MCNNRCVFCVSGQRTGMGEALPLPTEPILSRIREAKARGHDKITLLGGEPTLQPGFMDVVRECVALGFSEIVIFTNGVKTARAQVIDDVLATGGNFTWRISIQGATEASHEATTRKPGSFARIVRTLEHLAAREQRITVNMCVVGSNYESVDRFPALLSRYGVSQLHLDLMRPMDAGQRTVDELRALMPKLDLLVPPLTRMIAGFDEGFDVNIGNLPYCVAPHLARFIHHDGEMTETIAVDGDDDLSRPWNKYFVKRKDKQKPASCAECVFVERCSGVFETYAHFHGTDELVPIRPSRLAEVDPDGEFLALRLRGVTDALTDAWDVSARGTGEVELRLRADARVRLALRGPQAVDALARYGDVTVHRLAPLSALRPHVDALEGVARALEGAGLIAVHPIGEDAVTPLTASVAARLRRLRAAAPFGDLRFVDVRVSDEGARAELELVGPKGEAATVWLGEADGRPTGGYRVSEGTKPSDALVAGLRALLGVFRGAAERSIDAPV
jgi:MoaA/NifB/PqqE/SkfB family radical SAM enzyme